MKSLFDEVNSWHLSSDFELLFKINNIGKGWEIINKLETSTENKNFLVRYTALAYSFNSKLLRAKRDRLQSKMNIVSFLEYEPDDFLLNCINNKDVKFVKYIMWWLRESKDREGAIILAGEDLMFDLLETSIQGVEKIVTAKDDKQAEKVMRGFMRMEVIMKSEAYERAMRIKANIETQARNFEKNMDYLMGVVKEEMPDVAENLGWAEKQVLKRKNNQ